MQDIGKLMWAVHKAYEFYNTKEYTEPKNQYGEIIITRCNQFVNMICEDLGYYRFNGLLANSIVDTLWNDKETWETFMMPFSQMYVNTGELILAGVKADEHGHVCVLVPGEEVTSGKWVSNRVPVCANIGKTNFIGRGINYAFKEVPFIFRFKKYPKIYTQ